MCRKATITLQRSEWEELVMEHIQAFTDKPHAQEDLALACRYTTLVHNQHYIVRPRQSFRVLLQRLAQWVIHTCRAYANNDLQCCLTVQHWT